MSNVIVRIALVNLLLAGIYVAVLTLELGSVSIAAMVLAAVAVLINVVFLRSSITGKNASGRTDARDASTGPAIAPLARTLTAAEAAKLQQEPRKRKQAEPHELPPWLRVKDNIVMTWEGKHHVAPINGEDPFEAAQRLHAQLRSGGQAQAASRPDTPTVRTTES